MTRKFQWFYRALVVVAICFLSLATFRPQWIGVDCSKVVEHG